MNQGGLTRWLNQHIAIVVSLGLVFVTVFRVLQFTGFDTNGAYLVLAHADRAAILTATLTQVVVNAVPYLALQPPVLRWLQKGAKDGASESERWRSAIYPALLGPLLLVVSPITLVVPLSGLAGEFVGQRRARAIRAKAQQIEGEAKRREYLQEVVHTNDLFRFMWATSLVGVIVVSLNAPWLARERLTVSGPEDFVVGYVVDDGGDSWLVKDAEGSLIWVPSRTVESRELCTPLERGFLFTSIAALINERRGAECETDQNAREEG